MNKSHQLGRVMKHFILVLILGAFSNPIIAAPITYELTGALGVGSIGSNVPASFVSAVDPTVFGAWTGSLTYDVDTTVFSHNIQPTGAVAGKSYSGGLTAIDFELNNGIVLTSSGNGIEVFTGAVLPLFPMHYSTGGGWFIPNSFWLSGTPPAEFKNVISLISGGTSGVDPATTPLGLPPPALDSATGAVLSGRLCGDFDGDGVVSTGSECMELRATTAGSISQVPVPAAVWLFGSAIGLLAWIRRKTR